MSEPNLNTSQEPQVVLERLLRCMTQDERVFGEPISQVLFGWTWDDEGNAAVLAEDYLRQIREQGYPLPSDFADVPCPHAWSDEDEKLVRHEFALFLRHWRERILQKLEKELST